MGICAIDMKDYVIRPTLQYLGCWSPAAENLLLGTVAIESELGAHLKQGAGRGIGLGIFQIDEGTHRKIWDEYLAFDPDLASKVRGLASQREFLEEPHLELATNMSYATAIAWMIYQRASVKLPKEDDLQALARIWAVVFPKHELLEAKTEHNKLIKRFTKSYRKLAKPGRDLAA